MPIAREKVAMEVVKVTADMKAFKAYDNWQDPSWVH